jgi:spore coat polysaccharide biosynthesis protein SpsF
VLRPLAGGPLVLRQIERVRRSRRIDRLLVATSTDQTDNVLADLLLGAGVEVVRGPLEDVLARFVLAADAAADTDHIVRLTADCPFADPEVIDAVISRHLETGADYTASTLPRRTFPKGLDAEIMRADVLRAAAAEATDPYDREHVTAFIYARPERFRLEGVMQDAVEGEVRWTVDTPDDFTFVSAVYDALYPSNPTFSSDDVRALVRSDPNLANLGGDRRI